MASAWIENGPISLPSRLLAYGAGTLVIVLAVAGVGMGFDAASRKEMAPELGTGAGQGAAKDDALIAKPIVDLAPPTPAPPEAKDASDDADDAAAKADALAAQTAEAQAIQAKAANGGGDIDDVLASPSEKPPPPTKGPTDESPPGAPVNSDVPF